VENVLVIAAPGQGAQTPGFLSPWLELPGVAERLEWWSAVVGRDLVHYGTDAGAEEIRDTAVAQPLLVAAGLAVAETLFRGLGEGAAQVGATAGHSVGELTAAAIAGVLSPESALVLVRERGRAMAEASAAAETGMTAILGGEVDGVLAALDRHGLTAANINGAGQVVAAGAADRLAAFADDPPPGARLRALAVAGAFHTPYMESAVGTLRRLAGGIRAADPRIALVSNRDGEVVRRGPDMLDRLVNQIAAPVRWDLCMETLGRLGAGAVIELPPAGTLSGLVKRALPDVRRIPLKTPADLDNVRDLAEEAA
jgi:[acyl-carrier-protein] S-malonyltransferase